MRIYRLVHFPSEMYFGDKLLIRLTKNRRNSEVWWSTLNMSLFKLLKQFQKKIMARTFTAVVLLAIIAIAFAKRFHPLSRYKVSAQSDSFATQCTTDALNLRTAPNTGASIVRTLPKGTAVNVYSTNNGWAQVDGGYVSAQYLGNCGSVQKCTTDALNLRESPSTSSRVVRLLAAGTAVNVYSTSNGWSKVDGGYVSAQFLGACGAPPAPGPSGAFPLFKQCDGRWGNDRLGSSTVCRIGCLMSSVSMALAGLGRSIDGAGSNPGVLNRYLSSHGGYQGDLFIWGSVSRFGLGYIGQFRDKNQLATYFRQGKVVILNVRNGGHWVLCTGVTGSGFTVNDPGFNVGSYSFGEVVLGGVFNK
jgi:SH3-like domain-containing protein